MIALLALAACCIISLPLTAAEPQSAPHRLEPIQYNNPGLVVDLGVGLWAWPLPMDYDRDGDLDLVVSCPDKPYNGTYFFENPGPKPADSATSTSDSAPRHAGGLAPDTSAQPIFRPAVRIADGPTNVQVSYIDGAPVVMTPAKIYANFHDDQYSKPIKLPLPEKPDPQYKRYRANQWKLVDWEGDGDLDVIAGVEIWDDYGWDDAWDAEGNWKNGPLHGFVYLIENQSPATASPGPVAELPSRLATLATTAFAPPRKLNTTDGQPIDVFGMPGPSLADFDGDGDLDLLCGEFLDGFTYFENTGSRAAPQFATGRRIRQGTAAALSDQLLRMDLEMITPVALDWDGDGRLDLICGDEDGRVAFLRGSGLHEQHPLFSSPAYFQQEAADVKFGALAAPFGIDWDGDGDDDILCGNTAGYIGVIENLSGGSRPTFAAPRLLTSDWWVGPSQVSRQPIREQAGPKGSIQGPCEAKWGYSTLSVTDWNLDGHLDILTNGIWGRVQCWTNRASFSQQPPARAARLNVAWEGVPPKAAWTWWTPERGELATQWRTTPCAVDWNADGLTDLVMLDPEGYLALYERSRASRVTSSEQPTGPDGSGHSTLDTGLVLLPPQRVFKITGPCEFDGRHKPVGDKHDGLLRLNANRAGASGRRKLRVVDWDGDGRLDLLVNSVNVNWLRNIRTDDEGFVWFEDQGPLDDRVLAGHDTAPATVDWNKDGIPDLLVGAEDGRLYFKPNPRTEPTESERQALARTPHAAVVQSEFIFSDADAPTPQIHASTIAETPAGLVAAWFAGVKEKSPDVGIWVSRHVDGRWTPPVEVLNGVQHSTLRYPCWNPVLFQQPGGPLHLFSKVGPDPDSWWGMHQTSPDHGATWSRPVRLPAQIDGPVRNKPVLLPDGTLLCGSSTEYDGWRVHFELTKDWGLTWDRVGPINDGKEFGAIQPTILTHPPAVSPTGTGAAPQPFRLQALCRHQQRQHILSTWSDDLGRTWTPLEPLSLPNPNSGIDAVSLTDGRHLLIYNHTRQGRSPLNLALSSDGLEWQAAHVLESEPGEYSYPAIIQTADGLVHMTYTWKRRLVKHIVVDPARLTARPFVDGHWPN